jgi:hypothetical protein
MFLDDDELDAQLNTDWRREQVSIPQTLFQTPANTPAFPKAFHTYRSKQYETMYPMLPRKQAVVALSISTCMIDSDDEYPYAPPTP